MTLFKLHIKVVCLPAHSPKRNHPCFPDAFTMTNKTQNDDYPHHFQLPRPTTDPLFFSLILSSLLHGFLWESRIFKYIEIFHLRFLLLLRSSNFIGLLFLGDSRRWYGARFVSVWVLFFIKGPARISRDIWNGCRERKNKKVRFQIERNGPIGLGTQ